MLDINFILIKKIEIFSFREKQVSELAAYHSEKDDVVSQDLSLHYNALVYEFQHLISLCRFLDESNELGISTSEKISEVCNSIASNFNSISHIYQKLSSTDDDVFWINYLKDHYTDLSICYQNESQKFKFYQTK